jgi:hypothetical protein
MKFRPLHDSDILHTLNPNSHNLCGMYARRLSLFYRDVLQLLNEMEDKEETLPVV